MSKKLYALEQRSKEITLNILDLTRQVTDPNFSSKDKVSKKMLMDDLEQEFDELQKKINRLTPKKEPEKSEQENPFKPYSFSDLLNMPPKVWLVDQVFGVGDLGMIYGPSGCGKTFITIDFIVRMCIGRSWASRFSIERPLNVAYCGGEGVGSLPTRFKASAAHYDVSDIPNFTFFKTVPQFHNENDGTDSIFEFIIQYKKNLESGICQKLDVLVIDTLHTATVGAEENSSKDMGKIIQACKTASNNLECAVILIHHTNKSGEEERGSTSLRGAMDFMIRVKKDKEEETTATMSCSKLKDGEQWPEQKFNLEESEFCDSVHVLWDAPEDYKKSKTQDNTKELILCELRKNDQPLTVKLISEVVGKKLEYVRKILEKLISQGECQRRLNKPDQPTSPQNQWVYFIVKY